MKQFSLALLCGLFITLYSCIKSAEPADDPTCSGDCLFTLKQSEGTVVRLECFNKFGIKAKHPDTDSIIYGLPDQLDVRFEEEGKKVVFDGIFRTNTLVPSFPDPNVDPQTLFQVEVKSIQ